MDWRRGHVIGRGSSASVSTATSSLSDQVYAVKSVELSQAQFLQREQKILSILKSPYIVGYIDHGITKENNKMLYNLLMEFVRDGTLADTIHKQGGRLDECKITSYTRQVLLGLNYIHSMGIAHCDIKGQNILIGEGGAKIADFGCARWHDVDDDVAKPIGGTPMFMAPEVARGEYQGFPADVWALGCTVIEMATGSAPWPDQTDPLSVLYKIAYSEESPEVPDFLSIEAKDFLNKCLKRDAKERWTVEQLLKHPFLVESNCYSEKHILDFSFGSPTSILDQGVWNSIPESEPLGGIFKIDGGDLPMSRIGRLVTSCVGPTWIHDENWITIRTYNTENLTYFR